MYCQKCNAENADDAHRCLSCGYEFAHVSAAAAPVAAKTSGVAIAALVLGILAFVLCGITALPAVICGIIALVKISNSRGLLKGQGLAIAGLVAGLVSVVFTLLLVAIMVPAFSKAKDQAKASICMAHLRQLSVGVVMYAEDNDGEFPTASEWGDLVVDYTGSDKQVFSCLAGPEGIYGYAFNKNLDGLKMSEITSPGSMVTLFEADAVWNDAGGADMATFGRHGRPGCNVGFADGHVEFVPAERIGELKWKPNE